MNEIFDMRRFCKVISCDLAYVWKNYGITFIGLVLVPLYASFLAGLWAYIMEGEWSRPEQDDIGGMIVLSAIILIMTFPAATYGKMTDKWTGSGFILRPASVFEKFLSMIIVSVFVVPFVFLCCYLSVDAFCCLSGLISGYGLYDVVHGDINGDGSIIVHVWGLIYAAIGMNIFIFLLGAIVFRKYKAPLTVLSLFGISFFGSAIAVSVIDTLGKHFSEERLDGLSDWVSSLDASQINLYVNGIIDVTYLLFFALLSAAVFGRLKTIMH